MLDFARARDRMVDVQIARRGVRDPRVLDALRRVPREAFVEPGYEEFAYEDSPLPIGEGQTISQPFIVAFMIEAADVKPGERVLEVGAGSGKEAADERVAESLFSRAMGYSFESEKVFQYGGRIVRAKTVDHTQPDVTACIFWLKNRRPDLWRDVTRQEQTGRDGGPIEVTASARDAVIERIKALASRLPESEAEAPFVRGKRH